jgi:hypothetical protein
MSDPRASRYRRLAMAASDEHEAKLLRKLADEAEEGILCTSTKRSAAPSAALQVSPDTRPA